ncbi:MAG: DinB family protein [Chitinophagaceae bacterium]
MIRTIQDFIDRWREEKDATLKVLNALTNESLQQAVPGGRTIGRLANHIIETLSELPHKTGLPIVERSADYNTVSEIVTAYEAAADLIANAVVDDWNDDTLEQEDNMYGEMWKKGLSLWVLIVHQTHHRGQITILMRFAGLKVPGVYGPSKEEWIAYGREPMA